MEYAFILLGWLIPLAAAVFVLASLWQILRALGQMSAELTSIREVLERDRRP